MGQGEPSARPTSCSTSGSGHTALELQVDRAELVVSHPDQLPGAIQLLLSRAQTCCRERLAVRSADD